MPFVYAVPYFFAIPRHYGLIAFIDVLLYYEGTFIYRLHRINQCTAARN
jgi:hypothetical protein